MNSIKDRLDRNKLSKLCKLDTKSFGVGLYCITEELSNILVCRRDIKKSIEAIIEDNVKFREICTEACRVNEIATSYINEQRRNLEEDVEVAEELSEYLDRFDNTYDSLSSEKDIREIKLAIIELVWMIGDRDINIKLKKSIIEMSFRIAYREYRRDIGEKLKF